MARKTHVNGAVTLGRDWKMPINKIEGTLYNVHVGFDSIIDLYSSRISTLFKTVQK